MQGLFEFMAIPCSTFSSLLLPHHASLVWMHHPSHCFALLLNNNNNKLKLQRVASGGLVRRKISLVLHTFDPQGTIDFPLHDEEVSPDIVQAPPPTEGRINITLDKEIIRQLDLSPAHTLLRRYVYQIGDNMTPPPEDPKILFEQTVGFIINYERDDPLDPRELSEMPDIRLWFVRLDAAYPWLPVVLDWRSGELARYAAMLVPHQMSRRLGIVFNPEALELFAMKKLFIIYPWLKARNLAKPYAKLNDMMRMLGFTVSEELYELIDSSPPP